MRVDMALALVAMVTFCALLYIDRGIGDGTQDNYCEMRAIWEETNGEYGWPRHDEAKEEGCK